jgi:DNA repair protein RecO (recombination protein O)
MSGATVAASRGSRRVASPGQNAFVLNRYDWSETSLILDLFTRDSGRVAVAAKGAKRPYSQLRSVLMPFQRVVVQFGRTRGDEAADVHNLRSAEWAGQGVA